MLDGIFKSRTKMDRLRSAMAHQRERHLIWERRSAGLPEPWTDVEALRRPRRWSNAFRELDPTTIFVWKAAAGRARRTDALMAVACARLTNRLESLRAVGLPRCDAGSVRRWMLAWRALPSPKWKTVYRVNFCNKPGFGPGSSADDALERALLELTSKAEALVRAVRVDETPAALVDCCAGIGKFVANEIFCDLVSCGMARFGKWSHAGPGAMSGICHIETGALATEGTPARKGSSAELKARDLISEMTERQREVWAACGVQPALGWDGSGGAPPLAGLSASSRGRVTARFFDDMLCAWATRVKVDLVLAGGRPSAARS